MLNGRVVVVWSVLVSAIFLVSTRGNQLDIVEPCPGDGKNILLSSIPYNVCNKNTLLLYANTLEFIVFVDRGDYRCNHDSTHRVCAKLVDNSNGECKHLKWGSKDFWELTDQVQYDWSDLICSNKDRYNQQKPSGEHWCICMWATESLINQVVIP